MRKHRGLFEAMGNYLRQKLLDFGFCDIYYFSQWHSQDRDHCATEIQYPRVNDLRQKSVYSINLPMYGNHYKEPMKSTRFRLLHHCLFLLEDSAVNGGCPSLFRVTDVETLSRLSKPGIDIIFKNANKNRDIPRLSNENPAFLTSIVIQIRRTFW